MSRGRLLALDLAGVSRADRFEFWRELGGQTFATTAPAHWQRKIEVRSTTWLHERLALSRFSASPFSVIRGSAQVAAAEADVLKIRIYESGRTWLLRHDTMDVLTTNGIHIVDQSRQRTEVSTDRKHLTLFVHHKAVSYDPALHPHYRFVPAAGSDGAALNEAILALETAVVADPEAPHDDLVDDVLTLLRTLFEERKADLEDVRVSQARTTALRRYVRRNAGAGEMRLEDLCRIFGRSRSSIFRAFESQGGLQRFVQRCRLHSAFVALACTRGRRGIITEMAETFHFHSSSHFSTSFKQEFGVRPGEIVGAAADAGIEINEDTMVARQLSPELQSLNKQLYELYAKFRPLAAT